MIESSQAYIPKIQSIGITFASFDNKSNRPTFNDMVFPFIWFNNEVKGLLKNLIALLSNVMLLSTLSTTSFNYLVVYLPFLIEV